MILDSSHLVWYDERRLFLSFGQGFGGVLQRCASAAPQACPK